jgi:hypothetical protein
MIVSDDSKTMFASGDSGEIKMFDIEEQKMVKDFQCKFQGGTVFCMFLADGLLYLAGSSGSVCAVNLETKEVLWTWCHPGYFNFRCGGLSSDAGRLWVVSGAGCVNEFGLATWGTREGVEGTKEMVEVQELSEGIVKAIALSSW